MHATGKKQPLVSAMRIAMALVVLVASLAKGAVVVEIEHEHHHDHDFHHSHHHSHENVPSDHDDDGDKETAPERNTGTHTHHLVLDMGPMMSHSVSHAGFVSAGGKSACVTLHEPCPDGPTFELLKPPQ